MTGQQGRRKARWQGAISLVLPLVCLLVESAYAVEPSQRMHRFDVAAQPLAQALAQFSAQSGHAVLVPQSQAQGWDSRGVRGDYAPEQALAVLLDGTPFQARYAGRTAFTLERRSVQAAPDLRSMPYMARLQRTVIGVLCALPQAQYGRQRLAMQVWVNLEGRLERVHFLSEEAYAGQHQYVLGSLHGLTIPGRVPDNLAQPLTVLLAPRSSAASDCRQVGVPLP